MGIEPRAFSRATDETHARNSRKKLGGEGRSRVIPGIAPLTNQDPLYLAPRSITSRGALMPNSGGCKFGLDTYLLRRVGRFTGSDK